MHYTAVIKTPSQAKRKKKETDPTKNNHPSPPICFTILIDFQWMAR